MNFPDSVVQVNARLVAEERWLSAYERIAALRENPTFRGLVDDLRKSLDKHRAALVAPDASEPLSPYMQGWHRGAISVADVFISVMDETVPDRHKQRALQLKAELDKLLNGTGLTRADIEVPK